MATVYWMLGGGIVGMFSFLYLSIRRNETMWKPVAKSIRRRVTHHH